MTITKGKLIADPAVALDGDSVAAFLRDGSGNSISSTGGALHVELQNASIAVTATDLDIRNLVFADDKVDVSGSSNVAVVDGGGSLTVDAVDLDIRDLTHVSDSIKVGDGTDFLAVNADGSINITDNGGSITVDGTVAVSSVAGTVTVAASDLDIRDLAFATDSVTAHQGGSWSVTATATDFDIRDLTHVSDSVKIGDGTDFLAINGDGSINVQGTFSINGQYAEDSAHVSGDIGLYNLAVRADAPAVATSADGDYASQTVDAYNRSWVNTGANVSMSVGAASVTTTSALLVAAAAGRRRIRVLNNGSKVVYFGPSGVATSDGWPIAAGASDEFEIGPGIALHAVASTGTQEIRYVQLA